jgi:8-oxo-dGTP diphosphatase
MVKRAEMNRTRGLDDTTAAPVIRVVRLIVADAAGRVLLLRRPAAEGIDAWCLPGGKVEAGETIETAAARELLEETGLRLGQCRVILEQISPPMLDGDLVYVSHYLACEVRGVVALNAESVESAWLAPGDLSGYTIAFRNEQGILRYWSETGAK